MQVFQFSLGQLGTNCYFLIKENRCLIVDPADEASFILEELQRRNLKLIGMLSTHGHFDHVMAVGEIQKSFHIPLYISKKDLFLINRVEETAEFFLGYRPMIFKPTNIKFFNEKMFHLSSFTFHTISTPGHTPGSVCYYFEKERVIFTGDTLFKKGIGRCDFSYSDRDQLRNSLEKIFKLPKKTHVYPGHGERTTIGEEKKDLSSILSLIRSYSR